MDCIPGRVGADEGALLLERVGHGLDQPDGDEAQKEYGEYSPNDYEVTNDSDVLRDVPVSPDRGVRRAGGPQPPPDVILERIDDDHLAVIHPDGRSHQITL